MSNTTTEQYATKSEAEAALSRDGFRPVNWSAAPDTWVTRDGRVARVNLVHGAERVKVFHRGGPSADDPAVHMRAGTSWEYPVVGYWIQPWSMEESLLAYCVAEVFGTTA